MYDIVVIGAGPAGIALAAEARAIGYESSKVLVIEKGTAHNWAIRQYYPAHKKTTANYKGHIGQCEGLLCISDMSKDETIAFFDKVIAKYSVNIIYEVEGYGVSLVQESDNRYFHVETSKGSFNSKILAIAIGILGRPNRPKEYNLPVRLKDRLMFDITSRSIENENVLVVGGGDTAAEYVQHLYAQNNRVTLSYRQKEFTRLNQTNGEMLLAMEARNEVLILRGSNINGIEDINGRAQVKFTEDIYPSMSFDTVVYALGGTTPVNFLRTVGIAFEDGKPKMDAAGETSVPGLFLIGDLTMGRTGGSIITAFNSAARSIKRIDKLLGGKSMSVGSA